MRPRTSTVVMVVMLGGCRQLFGIDSPDLGKDAGMQYDAPALVDAGICTGVSSECANEVTLRQCTSTSMMATDTTCSWGCINGSALGLPHCGQLVPAGDGATTADTVDSSGLADVTITGTIDGDSGGISGLRDVGTGIRAGVDYELHNNVAIFRVASLQMSGTISLLGSHSIVIVSNGTATISKVIDLRTPCSGTTPGPGGFQGGAISLDAVGAGAGRGGGLSNGLGGSGGGFGGAGGNGGHASGAMPIPGGVAWGDAAISVLRGGGGGGGGGGGTTAAVGAGGGGAVQIISNTTITIGMGGGINAGGCGGPAAFMDAGGGGGAGGVIVLEAPSVTVAGALAVNGGGGGGGDSISLPGQPGSLDRNPAGGGTTAGAGAAGGTTNGLDGLTYVRPGGGGGAIGRIRINTRTGAATIQSTAVMSPAFDDHATTATQAKANVQ